MMHTKRIMLLVATSSLISTCFTQQLRSPSEIALSKGSEGFGLELFTKLSVALAQSSKQNDFMVSPFTVWSLLILLIEGSGGNTLLELQKTLQINADPLLLREGYKKIQRGLTVNTTTIEVSTLQAMFSDINRPVDRDYEDTIERLYEAKLIPVNFHRSKEAQNAINRFVASSTKGLINSVVKEADLQDAQMIMISAIYFRGQWKIPFNKTLTRHEPFQDENGNIIGNVSMMFQRGNFAFTSISELESHVLELPYGKENRLSMIILLPRKGVRLTSVIERLSTVGMSKIFQGLNKASESSDDEEVEVFMPKFITTTDFTLNVILEQMGILDLFDSTKADLKRITSQPIYLSRLIHKTKIEVNEEGTVAAAITGGSFANKATPPRFLINRPFAYVIIEKSTNSLLFCGQIRNPS